MDKNNNIFDIHSRLLSRYMVSPRALTCTVVQYHTQGILCYVLCDGHGTPLLSLDSGTGWTGELWTKTNLLVWQN